MWPSWKVKCGEGREGSWMSKFKFKFIRDSGSESLVSAHRLDSDPVSRLGEQLPTWSAAGL